MRYAPRHSLRSCPRRDLIESNAAERHPLGTLHNPRSEATMYRWSLTVVFALLLGLPSHGLTQGTATARSPSGAAPQATDSVWLNTNSGVYHCRGSQYYGTTVRGRFLSESDALKSGYRAAYGKSCGAPLAAVLSSSGGRGATGVRVWVNTSSRVYHCPGTRYYGNTKKGRYMPESEARSSGNRPAGGRSCS